VDASTALTSVINRSQWSTVAGEITHTGWNASIPFSSFRVRQIHGLIFSLRISSDASST
jgi:hypothetical protein